MARHKTTATRAEQGRKVNIWSSKSGSVYVKSSEAVCLKSLSPLPVCKLGFQIKSQPGSSHRVEAKESEGRITK